MSGNVYHRRIAYRSPGYQMLVFGKSIKMERFTTQELLHVLAPLAPPGNVRKVGARLVKRGYLVQPEENVWQITSAGVAALERSSIGYDVTTGRGPGGKTSKRRIPRR